MIVALWRRRNRCRAAMEIKALRRGTTGIFRNRVVRRHLLGNGALRPALGERRHLFHGRSGGSRRDRRLGLLVTPSEANIGQTL
jgi:ribosomal protein L35